MSMWTDTIGKHVYVSSAPGFSNYPNNFKYLPYAVTKLNPGVYV